MLISRRNLLEVRFAIISHFECIVRVDVHVVSLCSANWSYNRHGSLENGIGSQPRWALPRLAQFVAYNFVVPRFPRHTCCHEPSEETANKIQIQSENKEACTTSTKATGLS